MRDFFLVLAGPTAVGKTAISNRLVEKIPVEIVNCDVGQFYTALSIGTAKPDWKSENIRHHMFDILDEPQNFSVAGYRKTVKKIMQEIWEREKIPLVVGGSLFYINALFFPPLQSKNGNTEEKKIKLRDFETKHLHKLLKEIDPQRASEIGGTDRYRLERALEIWHDQGVAPSTLKPEFKPIANFHLIFLTRERKELYERINERTREMLKEGWIEEVENLPTKWKNFLQKKKLIGYPEIMNFLDEDEKGRSLEILTGKIQKNTRNYAKRQEIFWRKMRNKLLDSIVELNENNPEFYGEAQELNLTLQPVDLYIDQAIGQFNQKGFLPKNLKKN